MNAPVFTKMGVYAYILDALETLTLNLVLFFNSNLCYIYEEGIVFTENRVMGLE